VYFEKFVWTPHRRSFAITSLTEEAISPCKAGRGKERRWSGAANSGKKKASCATLGGKKKGVREKGSVSASNTGRKQRSNRTIGDPGAQIKREAKVLVPLDHKILDALGGRGICGQQLDWIRG